MNFWENKLVVDRFSRTPYSIPLKKFLTGIESPSKKRVLDIGCGAGRNTLLMAKMGFDIYAIDSSSLMLQEVRKKLNKVISKRKINKRIAKGNMLNLPYSSNLFDIVVANGVFHNARSFREFRRSINEASRVLKNNGLLYVNIFYRGRNSSMVKKTKYKYLYLTNNNLEVILVPKNELFKVFGSYNMTPINYKAFYKKAEFSGKRDIFRGVFKKCNR